MVFQAGWTLPSSLFRRACSSMSAMRTFRPRPTYPGRPADSARGVGEQADVPRSTMTTEQRSWTPAMNVTYLRAEFIDGPDG